MYKTKKAVDTHVRSALSKLRSEVECQLRSFTIAKLYYKINEFASAEHYLCSYLSIKEDNDQAYKLLGQCYKHLKKPEKALEAYQKSLQLNTKQPDLLADVCQLLLEDNYMNMNKLKYWCEMAESEKVQNDSVFSLRLKIMNLENNGGTNEVENILLKEISSHPNDINLRVRLVRHYIDNNKIHDAYSYVYDLEILHRNDLLVNNRDWSNIMWLALNKYEHLPNIMKDWNFWLMKTLCLERLVEKALLDNSSPAVDNPHIVEITNYLFNFDQHLFKITQLSANLNIQKELFDVFLNHYRGQLLLHAIAFVFKREQMQNKTKWKDIVRLMLPMLLLAYQAEVPQLKEVWMKHCDEVSKELIVMWQKEGSFRCAQAGRILLSCVNDKLSYQLNASCDLWPDGDQVICQVRQLCCNPHWRRNIFALLFCSADHKIQEQTSFLINDKKLAEPTYELPTYADVETYEEAAEYLHPHSLKHLVYLCLGNENLSDVRAAVFSGLNFSTQNLSFCGAESLNQLDVDSFLYATVLQTKRNFEVERDKNNYLVGKPAILTFANLHSALGTEEQCRWWHMAYMMYKNLSNINDLAQLRASLQNGIEVVRGINGPKMDVLIAFKLGQIFAARAQKMLKPVEKMHLELRAKSLFTNGLNMIKMRNKGILEPFHKYFKYANGQTAAAERELFAEAENAVTYLASQYFKKAEYEDLIEEFAGTQLPFATYLQAEAYRKLNDATKTSKKNKTLYLNKVGEYLNLTLSLLESSTCIDSNHPLNSIIHNEIKKVQQASVAHNLSRGSYFSPQDNSSAYEDAESDLSFEKRLDAEACNANKTEEITTQNRHSNYYNQELLEYVKKLSANFVQLKKEIMDILKSEFKEVKTSISCTKDEMQQLEIAIKKLQLTSNPMPCNEPSNPLNELHLMANNFQQQQQAPHQPGAVVCSSNHMSTNPYLSVIKPFAPMGAGLMPRYPPPNPAFMQMQSNSTMDVYNTPIFSSHPGNYPLNFVASNPGNGFLPQARQQQLNPCLPSLYYTDSAMTNPLNFNVPPFTTTNMFTSNVTTYANSRVNNNNSNNMLCNLYPNQPNLMNAKANAPPSFIPFPSDGMPLMSIPQSTAASTVAANFKNTLNNLPANVVITSSDPLPKPNNQTLQSQSLPVLSVNIPSYHIKSSLLNKPLQDADAKIIPTMASLTVSNVSNDSNANDLTQMPVSSGKTISYESQTSVNTDVDEYDPRPDFKGIIPLPDEVEVRTGEEDEDVMFCHRAKLFRLVDNEWKERGIGDMKILKSKQGATSRILMRRDQTHKICANHKITSEITLTAAKNDNRGFIWIANDFADETLQLETFFLRFKLPETAKQFQEAFKAAQQNAIVKANNKETQQQQQPEPTSIAVNGFSSVPAKVTGNNLESGFSFFTSTPFTKSEKSPVALGVAGTSLPSINNPITTKSSIGNFSFTAPLADSKNVVSKPADSADASCSTTTSTSLAFGNIFSNLNKGNNSPFSPGKVPTLFGALNNNEGKQDTQAGKATTSVLECKSNASLKSIIEQPKLQFGSTGSTENKEVSKDVQKEKVVENFGDVFKPKPGSWYCKECYVCNGSAELCCLACNAPKDGKVAGTSSNSFATSGAKMNFKFGFGDKQTSNEIVSTTSVAQATTKEVESNSLKSTNAKGLAVGGGIAVGFGDQFKPKAGSWTCEDCYLANDGHLLFCKACNSPKNNRAAAKENVFDSSSSLNPLFRFGFNRSNTENDSNAAANLSKDTNTTNALSITSPQVPFTFGANSASSKPMGEAAGGLFGNIGKPTAVLNSFSSVDKKEFNFTLKTKSPGKAAGNADDAATEGDDSYLEEENNAYFAPVIPLPEKIEVKTGEEDEDVLYEHRAKLYRFIDGEWKERGLGDVKILSHKTNGKLRVVMRRETVLKICLNHILNDDVEYKRKDEKSWLFAVNDYSEGEFELHRFSLRFKTKEVADGFMEAVQQALSGKAKPLVETAGNSSLAGSLSLKTEASGLSQEMKSTADRLQIPYEFFSDKQKCAGCCGCNPEDYNFAACSTNDMVNAEEMDSLQYPLTLPALTVPLEKTILKENLSQALHKNDSTAMESMNLKTTTAKPTTFLGTSSESHPTALNETTIFSGNENIFKFNTKDDKPFEKPLFGTAAAATTITDNNIFSGKSIFGNSTSSKLSDSIFGSNSNKGKLDFGSFTFNMFGETSNGPEARPTTTTTVSSNSNIWGLSINSNSTAAVDFATLAAKASNVSLTNTEPDPSKPVDFFGLINQNAFGRFSNAQKNDSNQNKNDESNNAKKEGVDEAEQDNANYDPHYDPIIALPDEIVVTTGEEEETKLFGERAKLFRWDETNKEWKERGVGELKILLHPEAQTYRMILRREQIHKLVLNHAIGSTFVINKMSRSPKEFMWAALNFAESTTGVLEKFAVRFKAETLAGSFHQTVEDCIRKRKQLEENMNVEASSN